jgi:GH25 family lysozyme M1 (1,4-beta-N-acetylmuramidase)
MPAPSRRWSMPILCAAASLALAGFSAAPAAAAPNARSAAGRLSAAPVSRSNVGAAHSPQLLRQLSGSSTSVPMTGTGQLAAGVLPPAAVAGDEQGVDVASFQHPGGAAIDWSQVAASGIGFAAVKATEGAYYHNPYALTDLAQAQAAGLSAVAYAFAIPNGNGSSSSPVTQADYLVQYLGSASRSVPIMLDIEYDPYGAECYGLSPTAMVSWISRFDSEIETRTGHLPIIYTPRSWWGTCTGSSTGFAHTPVWVPDFSSAAGPALPAGWSTWASWQYTSTGTVAGISDPGQTDLDQANPAILSLLEPANPDQVIGDPVGVQLGQAIPVPGQTVTFTATGLPPGVSLSASGQITGWLSRTGNYSVQIKASDAAGSPGSAAFGWTVAAAAGQGPTGPVRFDVGGKCLNDAGNRTANGTPVNIAACNGGSSQQWTMAADHTLRIHGKCLGISGSAKVSGAKTVLGTCLGYASQQWSVGSAAVLVNAPAGLCLAGSSSGTGGVQAWLSPCKGGKASQKWTRPAGPVVSEVPGLCLNDQGASTAAGNPVVIWSCGGQAAQNWTVQPDGTLRFSGKCLDITNSGPASGTPVDLLSCNGSASQQWRISAAGGGSLVQNPASGLCLADPGDATSNGAAVVVASCTAGDPGLVWRVR